MSTPLPSRSNLRLATRTLPAFMVARATWTEDERDAPYDVAIVGSGYGGSVAVHALALAKKAGRPLRVLLLERGKAFHPGDFPATFADLPREMRVARQDDDQVGNPEGLFDLRPGPDVSVLVANGVGGGSLINAGVLLVPDPKDIREPVLAARVKDLRDRGVFRRAIRLLGGEVLREGRWIRNNADRWPQGQVRKLEVLRQMARVRGERAEAVDISVGLDGGPNSAGTHLAPCNGCGDCMTGCNVGAKDSLDRNLLLQAQHLLGDALEIVTGATVASVDRDGGSWKLRVLHTDTRLQAREPGALHLYARRVVLAAGTLGSSEILLRSRGHRLVFSPALGASFSGNGDDIAAVHRLAHDTRSAADEDMPPALRHIGPTVTGFVRRPSAERPFLIEEFAVPGPVRRLFDEAVTTGHTLAEMARPDGDQHREDDPDPVAVDPAAMARTLLVGVIGHDDAGGSLRLARPVRPRAQVPQMGTLRVHWPDARWGREMDAAHEALRGFVEGPPPQGGAPTLVANPMWRLLPPGLEDLVSQPRGPLMTVHPLGGCRIGRSVHDGVVDLCGRVFDARPEGPEREADPWAGSLVVLDGSIVGGSLGVNPSLTITALALAAMDELLGNCPEWTDLGLAGAAIACRGEAAAAPQPPPDAPPWPTPPWALPVPRRTHVDIVERLVSEPLDLRQGAGAVVAELTLHFRPQAVQGLHAPQREPMKVDASRSRLRLYRADDWSEHVLAKVDDAARGPHVQFEAPLDGALRFLHREPSGPWRRALRGAWAWLRHRGMRDLWDRWVVGQFTEAGRQRRVARAASRPAHARRDSGGLAKLRDFFRLARRAGQVRRFDYALRLGAPVVDRGNWGTLLAEGCAIDGEKRLHYAHRISPWTQLQQVALTRCPGLDLQAPWARRPRLEVEPRFWAEQATALLRVAEQRNHAEALVELLSLGLYLLRVMIDGHLWTFRKPDVALAPPREPYRLPPPLPGLPEPQVTWLVVDQWPRDSLLEGQPVRVRLTRYPVAGRRTDAKPLVMIHGYSASGTTFAHPSLEPSAASWFHAAGRDVWVLDLRTSCGLDSARHPWSMETVALVDIPAALLHVRQLTGQRVDVLAHCIGASMLAMALLSDADSVAAGAQQLGVDDWLSSEQLGVLTAFNGPNPAGGPHPTIDRVVLSQKGPVMRYTDENILRAHVLQFVRRYLLPPDFRFQPSRDPGVAEQLLDRFLASLPYPKADFDTENPPYRPCALTPWTATRHRLDALFGRVFSAANLRAPTLEAIDDFFGPLNLDTVAQTIHFTRWGGITNQRGRGEFLTRERLHRRWGGIPTFAVHGQDNGLSDVHTLHLIDQQLGAAGVPLHTKAYPGFGHQDMLIGRGAGQLFQDIGLFLDGGEPPGATCSMRETAPPGTQVAEACWLGPRLVMPGGTPTARVAAMSRPDQGEGRLWMVPARLDPQGGWQVLPPDAAAWIQGEAGPSDRWLFVEAPDPWPDQVPGWLCVIVYDLGQTMAVRPRPPVQGSSPPAARASGAGAPAGPADGSAGPPNLPVRTPPAPAQNEPGAGRLVVPPGFQIPRPGLPLSDSRRGERFEALRAQDGVEAAIPLRMPADALASGRPDRGTVKGTQQAQVNVPAGVREAVESWLATRSTAEVEPVYVRIADLRRTAGLAHTDRLRFALGSCQYPAGLFDREVAGDSLERLADAVDAADGTGGVGLALMVGDQIYADASAGLADATRRDELYDLPHQRAFRLEAMRRVMRRMPVQMLLDDHELFDNWQPLPEGLAEDEKSPSLKRARRRIREARQNGLRAFLRYQRTQPIRDRKLPEHADLAFEAGGHAFYLLDTRSRRYRGQPVHPRLLDHIVSVEQRQLVHDWLMANRERVKFIATPSLVLPRRAETAADPGNACRSDAWDGFPNSMRWLLGLIEAHQLRHVVLLSGDEHHSLVSEVWIGEGERRVKVVSVHASALYAPYPFANGRPSELAGRESSADYGTPFTVETAFMPRGDGVAVLEVVRAPAGAVQLKIEFSRAGGLAAPPRLIALDG